MFEITITRTETVTVQRGNQWNVIEQRVDEKTEKVLDEYGYTPSYKDETEKHFTIYSQQIEDEDFSLPHVIAAINGLQVPVKVSK